MPNNDPYEVLGVPRNATADEIKSAYRRLARRYHPDVNQGDAEAEEKFKEIGQAYSILSDAEKKARFDQYGVTEDQPGAGQYYGNMGGVQDLFEAFFGGFGGFGGGFGSAGGRPGRDGDDIHVEAKLWLKDVLNGVHREIAVDRMTECDACGGKGTEGGVQPPACPTCKGQGMVITARQTMLGSMRTQTVCPTCQGAGYQITNPCKKCKGVMVVPQNERVNVTIPPGVEEGMSVQVPGQGHEGVLGGRPGDLYVQIVIADGSRFQRQGQTLLHVQPVTIAQACLGDTITVEGVDEEHTVEIPAGSQPGDRITVKGGGLPPVRGGRRGDLIVYCDLKVPTHLTEAQFGLLRDFAELGGEPIPKGAGNASLFGGFFKKKK